jgi:hypothetical protein
MRLKLLHFLTILNTPKRAWIHPSQVSLRRFSPSYDSSLNTRRTRFGGDWRVLIRRKGQYVSETFIQRKDAEM